MIIPNTPTFVLQLHHVETTATITKLGRKKTVKSHVECVKVSSMVRCLRNTNRVQKKVENVCVRFSENTATQFGVDAYKRLAKIVND